MTGLVRGGREVGSPGSQVARIAVLRCNALGDYFMATPALAALRRRFPHAEITLLAGRWHAEFLSGRPGPIDRVLVVPHVAGLQGQPAGAPSQHALPRFLADARDYRYDLAVQLHGGGAASNPLVGALGARRSIGLQADGAADLDTTVPYRYYQSEVFRFLEVVALVGAHGAPEYPELAASGRERATAAALLPPGGPYVALHAGAGDPRRRWAPQRFAAVADALTTAGARPLLVGSHADVPVSTAVRHHARTPPLDLTGRTDLGTLAAVLARWSPTTPGHYTWHARSGFPLSSCTGAATPSTPPPSAAPDTDPCSAGPSTARSAAPTPAPRASPTAPAKAATTSLRSSTRSRSPKYCTKSWTC
jgi:ADP-heptose:LPS heptosyltransferase